MAKNKKKKNFKKKQLLPSRLSGAVKAILMDCAVEIAEEICSAENYELVHTEFRYEGNSDVLCVYIDKEGGIQMRDCAQFSRQLGDNMDVRLDFEEKYRLEVSSPGIERPIVKEADYTRFKGEQIVIKTHDVVEGRKKFIGSIIGYTDGNAEILVDGTIIPIPFSNIKKAHLFADIGEK